MFWIRFALGAGDWILATLGIVDFYHILKRGGIDVAVVTGERSLFTLFILVGSYATTLEPLPTLVRTFYFNKPAPI